VDLEQLGPYRIERRIGSGGMGLVYAAVEEETGRRAALKVLSGPLAENEGFRERFSLEIETLKKLRHPNIVSLFGFGEDQGRLFYSMELIEGGSLQRELDAGRRFDWRETTRITIEICQALKHAHYHGVIHRDMKPANVLRVDDDHIKLTDFGIAKLFGATHVTLYGGAIGTADYMPPEQAEGQPVTPRSDLYSLGNVMYALLCGRPPFASRNVPEIMRMLKYDQPPPIASRVDLPEELATIIHQLLEKEPAKRIPTAMALANRLQAMDRGLGLKSRELVGRRHEEPEDAPPSNLDTDLPAPPEGAPSAIEPHGETIVAENSAARDSAGFDVDPSNGQPAIAERESSAPGGSRFTSVDAAAAGEPAHHPARRGLWPWWIRAAPPAITLLLIVAGIVYFSQPPSADALFASIEKQATEGPAALVEVQEEIQQFLTRFPDDPRSERIAELQEELELHRLSRRLKRRYAASPANLSAVERAFLEAAAENGRSIEQQASTLRAFLSVHGVGVGSEEQTRDIVALARRKLSQVEERMQAKAKQLLPLLDERLDQAQTLLTSDPDQARRILRGVIRLYEDKPWADEIVTRAKRMLNRLDAGQ